jgi:hypothetical protein
MRQFIGGDGSDTTETVFTYLQTARQIAIADLILIGEFDDPLATFLTNWNAPLSWPIWGTFQPTVYTRGKITSQIGLQVDTLEFTWSPPLTDFTTDVATSNPYQRAQAGFYDNKPFRLWRCVMPTQGDADTYGACEWFGGLISDTQVKRAKITFTVTSFLNVVNQQVPSNVIELTNTAANYAGATPVLVDAETVVPTFSVVAGSSETQIFGDCLGPTPGKIYGADKFLYGYMVFKPGSTLAGYWSAIGSNVSSGGHNKFVVYSAFPFDPTIGDEFYVSTQFPINQADGSYVGFPYVPNPQQAL